MIPLLLAVLLGAAALFIVVQPLLATDGRESAADAAVTPLADAIERERAAKQALLDVELDHRLGNLEGGDYAALRARYEERALAALKARYDTERALDAEIDQQLARLRARHADRREVGMAAPAPANAALARRAARHVAAPAGPNSARARRRRGG
jgi:hypothetical protein